MERQAAGTREALQRFAQACASVHLPFWARMHYMPPRS